MSRPTKQGITYFPLDTQFDDKLELIIADKGSDALSTIISLWQLIYSNEGYFCHDNSDTYLLIRRRTMLPVETIKDIINTAVDKNLFDKTLRKKHNILTSKAIQLRYFNAASRKKIVNVNKNYLLVDINEYKNILILDINVSRNATKVKEKSENVNVNINEKEDIVPPPSPFELFNLWNEFVKANNFSPALKLTEERKAKCKLRIKNYPIKKWLEIFAIISKTPFLNGDNDRGWKASFDWIVKNEENALKVLEGKYKSKAKDSLTDWDSVNLK